MLCCVISYHIISYHIVLYVMLCCVILLYHIILCRIMLCYVVLSGCVVMQYHDGDLGNINKIPREETKKVEWNKNNCYRVFVSRRPCFVVKCTTSMSKNLRKRKIIFYMICLEIQRFRNLFSPHIFSILYTTNLLFFSPIHNVFLHLYLYLYLQLFLAIDVFSCSQQQMSSCLFIR